MAVKILSLAEIKNKLNLSELLPQLIQSQIDAFTTSFQNQVILPSPVQLDFENPTGDCHIKAAALKKGRYFVIKCATGFYQNTAHNLPAGDGCYLILCQQSGMIKALFHDQGWLTTLRTALATLAVMKLTPWSIKKIGIIGFGQVAKMIIQLLSYSSYKVKPTVWCRSQEKLKCSQDFEFEIGASWQAITTDCDLVITTTASNTGYIEKFARDWQHVIALGCDGKNKQELKPQLFNQATHCLVDNIKQASCHGDTANALSMKLIEQSQLLEIGDLFLKKEKLAAGCIISDLTGIASQDLMLANYLSTMF